MQVSLSLFAFLFSEVVMYCQKRAASVGDIEGRLEEIGMHQGVRLLELLAHRERGLRRETRVLGMLSFVHMHVWKAPLAERQSPRLSVAACTCGRRRNGS